MWFRPAASALLAASLLAGGAFADDTAVAEPAQAAGPREAAEPTAAKRPARPQPLPIDMDVDADAVIPPAATHHLGREIAQTMHYTGAPWLVRESRQREEDCRLLLEALEVKKGQRICDLGCGNGFYTLELARRVGYIER